MPRLRSPRTRSPALLADEAGVVLLPGRGFGTHATRRAGCRWSNLNEADYAKIGRSIRKLFESYVEKYNAATGSKADKNVVKK